jgi:hypothetical protein
MARSGPLLTEAQWEKIAPLLPKPPKQRKGGRPWIENRRVLEGFCGFCAAALVGRTCRRSIRILPRAGGGCVTGTSRAFG